MHFAAPLPMKATIGRQQLLDVETTCESLLDQLQLIWDEVGETTDERDKMLLLLEQECLEIYRRTVDRANHARARLRQMIAEMLSELASLCTILGERVPRTQKPKEGGTLKEELAALVPLLENLRKRKDERLRQFVDLKAQIEKVHNELSGSLPVELSIFTMIDEPDLSLMRLDELHGRLQLFQEKKNERLCNVLEYVHTIHELCGVLSWDFREKIAEIHPSLNEASNIQVKSISNETIEQLANAIESLRKEKKERMQQLQDFGTSLVELWNLMDTPSEEQQSFQHVTCNIAASEHEITASGALSMDVLEQAKSEVERLHRLKASKIKEILVKKQTELEEICRKSHTLPHRNTTLGKTFTSMESGLVDPAEVLASIEEHIGRAREEAFSRKEILERVEKWINACEEETWLEDYNKDENRYNASRGAHMTLKRAERARATTIKIPALVESLMAKTMSWEEEKGKPFLYDGVALLSMLKEYTISRAEKAEEKQKHRDQRRLREQLVNEQETLFGSKPSPNSRTHKRILARKANDLTSALRRLSPGGGMLQAVNTPSRHGTSGNKESRKRPGALTSARPVISTDHNTLFAGMRQPLSPVSTPIVRHNMNLVQEGKKKRCNGSSLIKAPLPRSPLSAAPQCRLGVTDEENTIVKVSAAASRRMVPAGLPLAKPVVAGRQGLIADDSDCQVPSHTTPQEQKSMTDQLVQDQDQERLQPHSEAVCQQEIFQQRQQYSLAESQLSQDEQQQQQIITEQQKQQLQSALELSFEEKRLGFIYHSDAHLCAAWAGGCI